MVRQESRIIGRHRIDSATKHLLITGWSGKGKDMFGEGYITRKIGKKKVIDFHSIERAEGFFYGIKNTDVGFIKTAKQIYPKYKAQSFRSEIIAIAGENLNKVKTLPKNVKVRSLDINLLQNEKMIPFISTTESGDGLLEMIFYFVKATGINMNIIHVKYFLHKLISKELPDQLEEIFKGTARQTIFILIRNIINLENSGMFSDQYPKLSFEELIEDVDTISTISYSLLTSKLQVATAMGLISEMIREKREFTKDSNLTEILIYFRELQTIFNKDDALFYRNCDTIRKNIQFYLEQGRDNRITLAVNFQSFSQIPSNVWKHFQKVFALGIPSQDAEKLLLWADIDLNTLSKISKLGKGKGIYVANGEYRYVMMSIPTEHLKKQEGMNVLTYLSKIHGDYDVNYSNQLDNKNNYINEVDRAFSIISSSSYNTLGTGGENA